MASGCPTRSLWYQRIVRILVGVVLLAAAALKGRELFVVDSNVGLAVASSTFRPVIVVFEALLGLWLLSGMASRQAWLTCVACFAVFEAVSFSHAIDGARACGCFGATRINPWLTVALDLSALWALLCCSPRGCLSLTPDKGDSAIASIRRMPFRLLHGAEIYSICSLAILATATGLVALSWVRSSRSLPDAVNWNDSYPLAAWTDFLSVQSQRMEPTS